MTGATYLTNLCGAPDCSNPASDGDVCWSCVEELRSSLRAVPEVLADLLITVTRQDQGERSVGGGGSDEPPLLFRPEAADVARDLHAVLQAWTSVVMRPLGLDLTEIRRAAQPDIRRVPVGPQRPPVRGQVTVPERWRVDTVSGRFPGKDTLELARWLERHPDTIRRMPCAGALCDEIADAVARCLRACDRPGSRLYLGPCTCSTPELRQDLYARQESATVTCRACETVWNVEERRLFLLERSGRYLVTAETATRALPQLLGYELTFDMLRNLRRRWGLVAQPPAKHDPLQRPLYRIAEIAAAVASRAAAAQRRRVGPDPEARPPVEDLPPDVAALFTAVRQAAAGGRPVVTQSDGIDRAVRDS